MPGLAETLTAELRVDRVQSSASCQQATGQIGPAKVSLGALCRVRSYAFARRVVEGRRKRTTIAQPRNLAVSDLYGLWKEPGTPDASVGTSALGRKRQCHGPRRKDVDSGDDLAREQRHADRRNILDRLK